MSIVTSASLPKTLVINSRDKTATSSTNSNFDIECSESYLTQAVKRIVIEDAVVPNVFTNINNNNNILEFKEAPAGPLLQAFIPVGQYNIAQLILALETEIQALVTVGNTPTITLNPITNKLLIDMALTGIILLNKSTIAEVIGMVPNDDILNVGLQTSLPRIINLSGLPIVYIHSRALSSGHGIDAGKGITNFVVAIPMADVPYGAYGSLRPKDYVVSEIVYDSPRNITSLDIRLRDSDGQLLDIQNNHMTLIVKLYF